jgi:hypothetical protein
MSWGTCYSGSNNIHYNFPPIMADGRIFSSWQPDAVINENIQKQENIHSNWSYRQYMTNNGLQIMKYNNLEACNLLGLPTHFNTNQFPSTNVSQNPHLYKSTYDTNNPGYGYNNSNLKSPYLSREQLQSRMVSPSIVLVPPHMVNK